MTLTLQQVRQALKPFGITIVADGIGYSLYWRGAKEATNWASSIERAYQLGMAMIDERYLND